MKPWPKQYITCSNCGAQIEDLGQQEVACPKCKTVRIRIRVIRSTPPERVRVRI